VSRATAHRPSARALAALLRRDPSLGPWLRSRPFPGFPVPAQARNQSHFAALGRAILSQQVTTKAATTIHRRVCALTPGPRFPRPESMPGLAEGLLRTAGVSGPKQRSLVDLAERVLDGRLKLGGMSRLTDKAIIEHLVSVRGIGVWSAQMFLIFRLGRLDVMPSTDLAIQQGVKNLDCLTERPTPRQVDLRALAWEPLRSVAAWALWRTTDTEL